MDDSKKCPLDALTVLAEFEELPEPE